LPSRGNLFTFPVRLKPEELVPGNEIFSSAFFSSFDRRLLRTSLGLGKSAQRLNWSAVKNIGTPHIAGKTTEWQWALFFASAKG